jgi:phosphonate transport system substrate-binding protein
MTEHPVGFSVCPHDTAKHVVEWFHFNTYLQRKLGCGMHFEPKESFLLEQTDVLSGGIQLVYANPLSACLYIQEMGFIPVARPVNLYDETMLIGRRGVGVPQKKPLAIASASGEIITHTLGIGLLEALHIPHDDCHFVATDTHVQSMHAVLKGTADLAFVFNDTWNNVADTTRAELEVLAESHEQLAFHCFLVAPEWAHRKDEIQQILVDMKNESKGKLILVSLDLEGFEPLTPEAMDTLQTLMVYYNTLFNSA